MSMRRSEPQKRTQLMPDDKIVELIERGRASLLAQVSAVGRLLRDCFVEGANVVDIAEAQSLTHQIKGTSGSIGFMELASAATALDKELQTLLNQSAHVGKNNLQASQALLARLESIAAITYCKNSTLYEMDLSSFADRK